MRNLEKLKMKELTDAELSNVNGGNWIVGVLLSFAYDVVSDWPANQAAFEKGFSRRD